MNLISILISIVKADFLERTRRSSFLVTLCMIVYLGYAVNSGQILIKLGVYRGVYNSAWVGSLMAIVVTFFLGLIGFFLVKNTIERDERSGVGQILAASSLTRPQYMLGKWLSNFAVLSSLVVILALAAILMQVIQREDTHLRIWPLIAPLVFIALPMMALASALAVFFESIHWLKGGFGSLVYYGVFISLLAVGVFLPQAPWLDVVGFNLVGSHMRAAARTAFPNYDGSFVLAMISGKPLQTFVWPGMDWSAGLILQRLMWLVISMAVALFGSLFFDRFDGNRSVATRRIFSNGKQKPQSTESLPEGEMSLNHVDLKVVQLTTLSIDSRSRFHFNILRLVWLECLLLVKGLKWYWLAGLAALWVGCAFIPSEGIRKFSFMFISVWPVLVWSRMGEREARHQAEQLVYQAAYPVARLLYSAWFAGVIVTASAISGVLVGRLIYDAPLECIPWALSILFIPTLALTLGVWSHSSKPFEVVYPILWYLGPFNPQNGLAILDYLGIHSQAPVNTSPLLFVSGIFLLLLLALIGRKRQIIV